MADVPVLSFENEVFVCYAFYTAVMVLKMFLMGFMTVKQRITHNVFANPEDYFDAANKTRKIIFDHEAVERVRRNHMNDLENIPAFIILGGLYLFISPGPSTAMWHYRVFAGSRIMHTIVYQLAITQPARAIAHIIGLVTNISMAVQIIMATM